MEGIEEPLLDKDLLEIYWRLVIRDDYSIMRTQTIEANHFERKLALITRI